MPSNPGRVVGRKGKKKGNGCASEANHRRGCDQVLGPGTGGRGKCPRRVGCGEESGLSRVASRSPTTSSFFPHGLLPVQQRADGKIIMEKKGGNAIRSRPEYPPNSFFPQSDKKQLAGTFRPPRATDCRGPDTPVPRRRDLAAGPGTFLRRPQGVGARGWDCQGSRRKALAAHAAAVEVRQATAGSSSFRAWDGMGQGRGPAVRADVVIDATARAA